MNFLFILGSIVFTILGQLLLKKGAIELSVGSNTLSYFLNISILFGLFSGGLGAIFWIKALRFYDLSYAYPFTSLTFVCVIVLSGLVFGESIKWNQWVGLMVVMAGIYIGSR